MSPETATLIAAAISGAAAIGVAVVGVIGARSHRQTREQLAENTTKTDAVLHQVANDHGTNLRHDVDKLDARLSGIASMLGQVQKTTKETKRAQESHDAASVMLVAELHKADRALWAEIAKHHPKQKG